MLTLRPAADTQPAEWAVQGVREFGEGVGSLVPAVFESYARVFHPAGLGDQEVRWEDVARANARVMHPAAEWGSLTGSWEIDGQPGLWDGEPSLGRVPSGVGKRLAETLARRTATPDRCWFGVWEGWGTGGLSMGFKVGTPEQDRRRAWERAEAEIAEWRELLDRAPKFPMPQRKMHLIEGPLSAVSEFFEFFRQPPSLWWPDDRTWCVATDIDLMTTYVGGNSDTIQALLADEQIEALPVPVDQRVDWEADTVNPLPAAPGTHTTIDPRQVVGEQGHATGRVMGWDPDLGQGRIASPDLPGDVWIHHAHVEGNVRRVRVGVTVEFDWIAPAGGQDGYVYKATRVWLT